MASITSYTTKHGKKWRYTLSYKDDNGNLKAALKQKKRPTSLIQKQKLT